jgi:hypothetical protein
MIQANLLNVEQTMFEVYFASVFGEIKGEICEGLRRKSPKSGTSDPTQLLVET